MNNKEKATEIVSQMIGTSSDYYEFCYDAALEMAMWKDKQFGKEKKELIDKVVDFFQKTIDSIRNSTICNIQYNCKS